MRLGPGCPPFVGVNIPMTDRAFHLRPLYLRRIVIDFHWRSPHPHTGHGPKEKPISTDDRRLTRRRRGGQTQYQRYREVLRVLVRHGFGFVAGGRNPFRRLSPEEEASEALGRPAQLREALEELGVTFIKLGQILSTRSDLLPPAYITELQKLQDAVPPEPVATIIATIEGELGRPVGELFASFDPVPLAAASIGQVHAVTLPGGIDAVVKVQRTGVRDQVNLDLDIAMRLARLAEARLNVTERTGMNLPALVEEFAWTLRNELDYVREARNAEIFQRNFGESPRIRIPAICWEYTTGRLITMERLRGLRIDDVAGLRAVGHLPDELAIHSARLVLKEVFEDGFFHADLHPGNLFVLDGGIVGVIDFGMVGTIDEATRTQLLLLLVAVASQDAERITDYLFRLGVVPSVRTDRVSLRRDIQRLVAQYYGLDLDEINISVLLTDLLAAVRRHRLQLPPDLALLLKMLVMIEGVARTLDPQFNMLAVAQPYGAEAIARLFAPERIAKQLRQAVLDVVDVSFDLPLRLDRLLRQAEQGAQRAQEEVDQIQSVVLNSINRLSVGVLIAGFIIGLGVVILAIRPSASDGWFRLFIVAGFAAASFLGAFFFWSLWRSGRS